MMKKLTADSKTVVSRIPHGWSFILTKLLYTPTRSLGLTFADDVVLVADSGAELQAMLDVVERHMSRWKMKYNCRKSKVMVVGKRDAGVSWKIGEDIVEEVEDFK